MLSLAIKQLKIGQIHTSTITQQIHNKILFVVAGLQHRYHLLCFC